MMKGDHIEPPIGFQTRAGVIIMAQFIKMEVAEFCRGTHVMAKTYIAISAILFALVAVGHVVRLVQGWHVQLGDIGVAMSVSWIALVVSVTLAVWGAMLLVRR